MLFIILLLIGLSLSLLITKYFCNTKNSNFLVDIPNERSLHERPTPRSGGIAILISIAVTSCFLIWNVEIGSYFWIYIAALILAIVSYFDDKNHIEARYRFFVHLLVAGGLVIVGISVTTINFPNYSLNLGAAVGGVFSALLIIWLINLYNFMDGMDGFAGGMGFIGFSIFALLGLLQSEIVFSIASAAIAAAVGGFLLFNFPPAKIFMGDSGSSVLGLFVACFILWADVEKIFPLWIGILIFSPFIVDATVTLLKRVLNKEKVWEAHKTHYYQRLVQHGWGHKKTVLMEYLLMLLCGTSGIVAAQLTAIYQWFVLIIWGLIYLGMILLLNRYLSKSNVDREVKV